MLTQKEVQFYRENGYLVKDNVLSREELTALQTVTDEFVEKSRTLEENNEIYELETDHSFDYPRIRRIKKPTTHHEVYDQTQSNPKILDIVEALVGPDIAVNGSKVNMKTAGVGCPVEWHQDWPFHPHTNDDLLAVGVYLDDATTENGCMLAIPGSHQGPILDHHQDGCFIGAVSEESFNAEGAVPLEVKAGGISIHHARTLHGSAPNQSGNPRRLLLFQFLAADAWPLYGSADYWPEWSDYENSILRGKPTHRPRMADVPQYLPHPKHNYRGSIFQTQRKLKKSLFA